MPPLPAYDHDDLGACFYRVKRQLDEVDRQRHRCPISGSSGRLHRCAPGAAATTATDRIADSAPTWSTPAHPTSPTARATKATR